MARGYMNILTRKIARNTVGTADSRIYESTADIERDLRARKVDAVALVPDDYLKLRKKIPLIPLAMTATQSGHEIELLLLARRDAPIQTVKDLRNRSVSIPARVSQYGSFYISWLDLLTLRLGFKGNKEFFGTVMETMKPSQALMQVFFRKSDACVVTRQMFETTRELNPQIGRELAVIARQPKLAGGIIAVRSDYPNEHSERITKELLSLHEDNEGKQLFVLFQLRRLIAYRPEYLKETETFYTDLNSLSRRFGIKSPMEQQ